MNKTFTGVTPAQMANLRAQLAAQGVSVPDSNAGTIVGHGIVADFSYDGTAVLSVAITTKPWYIAADMIFAQIQSHLG